MLGQHRRSHTGHVVGSGAGSVQVASVTSTQPSLRSDPAAVPRALTLRTTGHLPYRPGLTCTRPPRLPHEESRSELQDPPGCPS